jgi:hypothetical protein
MKNILRTPLALLLIVLSLFLILTFLQYRNLDAPGGPLFVSPHRVLARLATLFFILLFLCSALLVGLSIIRRYNLFTQWSPTELLVALAVGLTGYTLASFLLAALGAYRKWLAWVIILLPIIVRLDLLIPFSKRCMDSFKNALEAGPRVPVVFFGILCFVLLPTLIATLTPPNHWDELVYQLTIPKEYVRAGGFVRMDYLVYFDAPHNVNLLYTLCLLAANDISARLLHFCLGIFSAIVLFVLCKRYYDAISGWVAALIFLATPIVMTELKAALVDLGMTFFFLLSVYMILRWKEERRRGLIVLAGIFSGIMLGCKYPAIYALPALLMLIIASPIPAQQNQISSTRRSGSAMHGLIIFCLLTLLFLLPWLIKNFILTGNPVYPNLYRIFDGRDWSPALARHVSIWLQSMGMGKGLGDFLLLTWRMTVYGWHTYERFAGIITPFYFFPLIFIPFAWRRTRLTLHLLLAVVIYMACWFWGSQQVRFFIPGLALMSIVAGSLIARCFAQNGYFKSPLPIVLSYMVIAGVSLLIDPRDLNFLGQNLGVAFGRDSKAQFLEQTCSVDIQPMVDYINTNLSNDARILMLFENRGYYLERDYVADGTFEVSRIAQMITTADSPEALYAQLKQKGITHVLINTVYWNSPAGDFIRRFFPIFEEKLAQFKERYLEEVTKRRWAILYRINPR